MSKPNLSFSLVLTTLMSFILAVAANATGNALTNQAKTVIDRLPRLVSTILFYQAPAWTFILSIIILLLTFRLFTAWSNHQDAGALGDDHASTAELLRNLRDLYTTQVEAQKSIIEDLMRKSLAAAEEAGKHKRTAAEEAARADKNFASFSMLAATCGSAHSIAHGILAVQYEEANASEAALRKAFGRVPKTTAAEFNKWFLVGMRASRPYPPQGEIPDGPPTRVLLCLAGALYGRLTIATVVADLFTSLTAFTARIVVDRPGLTPLEIFDLHTQQYKSVIFKVYEH